MVRANKIPKNSVDRFLVSVLVGCTGAVFVLQKYAEFLSYITLRKCNNKFLHGNIKLDFLSQTCIITARLQKGMVVPCNEANKNFRKKTFDFFPEKNATITFAPDLSDGVMVAQQILVLFV